MSGSDRQYPVGTLAEMAAIPEKALPRFLAELPVLLQLERDRQAMNLALAGVAEMIPDLTPVWIDDDLGEVTITVRSEDESFSVTSKMGT